MKPQIRILELEVSPNAGGVAQTFALCQKPGVLAVPRCQWWTSESEKFTSPLVTASRSPKGPIKVLCIVFQHMLAIPPI